MSTPTIVCKPNGPYLVKGLADLNNSRGERLPADAVVALCRCGGSATKPFCDGTHKKNGFSSARSTDGNTDRRHGYPGTRITIHDNRGVCAHSGICTDRLAAVFKYGSEPWIDPEGAAAEAIVATVRACPSGALSYSIDGAEPPYSSRDPAITVSKDGPYAVVGNVPLEGAEWGQGAVTEHYTLCRCGASKNKPFCDGSHYDIGFASDVS